MGLEPAAEEMLGGTAGYTVVEVFGGAANAFAVHQANTNAEADLNSKGKYLKVFMLNSKVKSKKAQAPLTAPIGYGLMMLK